MKPSERLKRLGDPAEPHQVKQSLATRPDAASGPNQPAPSGHGIGPAIYAAIAVVALVVVVLAALALSSSASKHASKGKGASTAATVSIAKYAAGAGAHYRSPDRVFQVAFPGSPSADTTAQHVHSVVSRWQPGSFVEVDDADGIAPHGTAFAVAVWLERIAHRIENSTRAHVLHHDAGALPAGDLYYDTTYSYFTPKGALVASKRFVVHGRHLIVLTLIDRKEQPRAFQHFVTSFTTGATPTETKNATAEDKALPFGAFNSLDTLVPWSSADHTVSLVLPTTAKTARGTGQDSLTEDAQSQPDEQHLVEVVITTYGNPLTTDKAAFAFARGYERNLVVGKNGTVTKATTGHLGSRPYLDFAMTYVDGGTVYRRSRIVIDGKRTVLVQVDDAVGDAPATFDHVVDGLQFGH